MFLGSFWRVTRGFSGKIVLRVQVRVAGAIPVGLPVPLPISTSTWLPPLNITTPAVLQPSKASIPLCSITPTPLHEYKKWLRLYMFLFILCLWRPTWAQSARFQVMRKSHVQWLYQLKQCCNIMENVMIFLLFIYTCLPHVELSLHAFIMFLLSSFRSNMAAFHHHAFSSTHVYRSSFNICISYMWLTCILFTYLLHAMQAWLSCI